MHLAQIALLVMAGFFAGVANTIAGGGSLVVFPALMATGLTPLQANVTNSVAQWPSYLGGVIGFRRELDGQWRRIATLVPFAIAGTVIGCALLLTLPAAAFNAVVPALVIGASVMLALQPRIRRWADRRTGRARTTPTDSAQTRRASSIRLFATVFLAAIYGGYFGGALGVILVAVLAIVLPETLGRINALKTVLSLIIATVTTIVFAVFAPLDWRDVAIVSPSGLLGGLAGARIARRVREDVLRWIIVTLGVAVGIYLIVHAVRG